MNRCIGAFALAVMLVAAGCGNQGGKDKPQPPVVSREHIVFTQDNPQLTAFVSEPVTLRSSETVQLNGRMVWDEERTVRIYAPFAGRVESILVQPGEHVAREQTLATLASPDFGQAQADARKAASDYALAQQNLARVKDLFEHGVLAKKDMNAAEADYARAESERQRAAERLRLYGSPEDAVNQRFPLKSPIAGVLVERNINPGQELRPDQMGSAPAQFVVTDPTRLWVQLDVPERDLGGIRPGQAMTIVTSAYPGVSFKGTVTTVADFVDPVTRMVKVRGKADNADRKLKGEMFVTAGVEIPVSAQAQAPSRALFTQGGVSYVFVDDGKGGYTRRQVAIGRERDGRVAVLSGLAEGERVVVQGALLLQQVLQESHGAAPPKDS